MYRPVPWVMRGSLPLTKKISHWSICVILNTGETIVISYEAEVAIYVFMGRVNEEKQIITYSKFLNIIIKRFDIPLEKQITLSNFLEIFLEYVSKNYKYYTVFGKSNCQYATKEILEIIFNIHDEEIIPENSNTTIFSDIKNYKKYSTNFKNLTHKNIFNK